MRYGKLWIALLTAVMVFAAVLFWRQEPELQEQVPDQVNIPLSVVINVGGEEEKINLWQSGAGYYAAFLPSCAEMKTMSLVLELGAEAMLDGTALVSGASCEDYHWEEPYALTCTDGEHTWEGALVFLRSGDVPSMHIDVQSGNMEYIHALKGNKESGRISIYHADGTRAFVGNLKSISGRGNATWTMEKKPYSLVLAGEADLLGLGQAQRWVLLANGSDPTHFRNKFVYDYASDAGLDYAPNCSWVDLYLNGEYAGLYLLSERNEIHPQRVALAENSSFLVSMELGWRLEDQGYPFISTDNGFDLRIHHSSITEAELAQIWQSAENAILASDGIDPTTGKDWTELIDLDSWARKYLIEEIFGSVDAGAVSQYFYGDTADKKIYAGPVWDYDIALGNAGAWQLTQPQAFFADRPRLNAWADKPWFYALCRKEAFRQRVVELYQEDFRPLLQRYLEEKTQFYAQQISQAAQMNQLRWQTGDPASETGYLVEYMTQRMAFLDSLWLENETYYTVLVDTNDGSNTACYAVREGDALPQLRDVTYIPDAIGWFHRDSDMPVDISQPVEKNLDIYLKYETWEGESWSESGGWASRISRVPFLVLLGILTWLCICDIFWQKPRHSSGKKKDKAMRN